MTLRPSARIVAGNRFAVVDTGRVVAILFLSGTNLRMGFMGWVLYLDDPKLSQVVVPSYLGLGLGFRRKRLGLYPVFVCPGQVFVFFFAVTGFLSFFRPATFAGLGELATFDLAEQRP